MSSDSPDLHQCAFCTNTASICCWRHRIPSAYTWKATVWIFDKLTIRAFSSHFECYGIFFDRICIGNSLENWNLAKNWALTKIKFRRKMFKICQEIEICSAKVKIRNMFWKSKKKSKKFSLKLNLPSDTSDEISIEM